MTVLWDLDGTLVHSAPATVESLRVALDATGYQSLDIDAGVIMGPALSTALDALGVRSEDIDAVRTTYLENFIECAISRVKPFRGIPMLLTGLRRSGVRQGIVTNRSQDVAARISRVTGLDALVEVVCGRTHPGEIKIDVLRRALARLGATSGGTLVLVGDRDADLVAGRSQGLSTIGVLWGYAAPNELSAHVGSVASSVDELSQLLSSMGAKDEASQGNSDGHRIDDCFPGTRSS